MSLKTVSNQQLPVILSNYCIINLNINPKLSCVHNTTEQCTTGGLSYIITLSNYISLSESLGCKGTLSSKMKNVVERRMSFVVLLDMVLV